MDFGPDCGDPLFLQRTLAGYAQALASLAASSAGNAGSATFEEGYRQLFAAAAPAGPAPQEAPAGTPDGAWSRYQAAAARWAEVVSAIARDAGSRLAEALRHAGPEAPPITGLAALQALWIDCGEAAYGEAARGEAFAAALAELLMATVELSAPR